MRTHPFECAHAHLTFKSTFEKLNRFIDEVTLITDHLYRVCFRVKTVADLVSIKGYHFPQFPSLNFDSSNFFNTKSYCYFIVKLVNIKILWQRTSMWDVEARLI